MPDKYEKRLNASYARRERSEGMNLQELVPYMHDLLEKWNHLRRFIKENTTRVDLSADAERRLRKAQSEFDVLGSEVLTCLFSMKKFIHASLVKGGPASQREAELLWQGKRLRRGGNWVLFHEDIERFKEEHPDLAANFMQYFAPEIQSMLTDVDYELPDWEEEQLA